MVPRLVGAAVILSEAITEVRRLSASLDESLRTYQESAEKVAKAERDYRRAKGLAWVKQVAGTAAHREAQVDSETADLRYLRDVAEGMRRAAIESIRARTTQISVIQSLLSAHKAEAQFDRTRPGTDFDNNRYP